MKVTQSIRHDEYRWSMRFSLRFFLFFWMLIFPGAIFAIKFDFTKKSFRVASLVSSYISAITAIVLRDNCVSSRRDYEEIRDHSAEKRWTRGLCRLPIKAKCLAPILRLHCSNIPLTLDFWNRDATTTIYEGLIYTSLRVVEQTSHWRICDLWVFYVYSCRGPPVWVCDFSGRTQHRHSFSRPTTGRCTNVKQSNICLVQV